MTEYDFSPEAYERYLEKQNNIARWVDKTRRYVPSNPFFPTTPAAQYAALNTHVDRTDPQSHRHHRSHSSHSSHSSKHQTRRQPPSSSHHRTASHSIPTAPPAQWQPVVDRRSDAHYRRAPQHDAAPHQQHYSAPPRPLRSSTAPVYLYPAPGRTSYAPAYPNPMAPHANTRRVGPGRSGHSVSGSGHKNVACH